MERFLFTCVGVLIGIMLTNSLTHRIMSSSCDKEMRIMIGGHEYVCMKVPSEGLPRNNQELMRSYHESY
jgi:hypothetical protein